MVIQWKVAALWIDLDKVTFIRIQSEEHGRLF